MPREKTNRINLYKVSEKYNFSDLRFLGDGYIQEFEDSTRKLYIQRKKTGVPGWVNYLKPLISEDPDGITNHSSSFILLVQHNGSIYALCGGSGYARLEEYIEEDFGMRLALRMIGEKDILALNQRSLKGATRQIYRAVVGYDPIFDKENFTRVLNSIAGKGEFEGKTFRIDGKASLVLRTVKDISRLSEVLTEIEAISSQSEKIIFPKSFVVEKDKTVLRDLDATMLQMVQGFWSGASGRDRLYLEFKDIFVQFRCERFEGEYGKIGIKFTEFDLDVIKEAFIREGLNAINSIDDLGKIMITGFNENGYDEIYENLLGLIVCEVDKDGHSFIKIGGRWLRILSEIQEFINSELKTINLLPVFLPEWNRSAHPKELDYNKFVATQNAWVCMDQEFIHDGTSKIEVCDVYDKAEKKFFHIKETWGSKSSYLFVQGSTAAEFFYNSDSFRKKCEEKWPAQFDGRINYKIVFGIAADKANEAEFPLNMTFFAKLSLYNAVSILKQIGYIAYLTPIRIINS